MKKSFCATAVVFLFMLAGCSSETPSTSDVSSQPDKNAASISFISSMGCNDQNCTDASHHHDCPTTCTDYDHYHNCDLDCSEAEHHHSQIHHQDDHQANASGGTTAAFVSGMGCNDQSCTDASHHHDCPTTCTDYDHYHSCDLDCSEAEHHHSQIHHQDDHQANASGGITAAFVSGMGCNDQSCTDASHHHDCPTTCTDYDHYHNCALDCAEIGHHHTGQTASGDHGEHHGNSHH